MIKGLIHHEVLIIINIYVPKIEAPKYIKKILADMKREMAYNKIIVGASIPHFQKWIIQTEKQCGNTALEPYCEPHELNRHIQDI